MWNKALFLMVSVIVAVSLALYLEPPLPSEVRHVLIVLFQIYIALALLCFIVSTLANNYSQVDKLWSVAPIIYVWVACAMLGWEPRLILMAILVTAWGIRLTLNFGRRGGYSWRFWEGEQDYRWNEVRKRPGFSHPLAWPAFNLVFISYYQMGLILLFTLPIVKSAGDMPLGIIDVLLAGAFVLLLVWQTMADNQQWGFQTAKHAQLNKGHELSDDYAHGFVRTGLWAKSRHPNYACEQGMWICIYLFSVVATGQWLNWSIAGAGLLMLLFHESSNLSEELSAAKYPEYKDYQKQVPRFVPRLFGR